MRKRTLILCVALTVLLAGGCVYGYIKLFSNPDSEIPKDLTYKVLPPDAVAVAHFTRYHSLVTALADTTGYLGPMLCAGGGFDRFLHQFSDFVNARQPELLQAETICSLHQAQKITLHVLMGMNLDLMDKDSWWDSFVSMFHIPVLRKQYDADQVYCLYSEEAPFYIAFYQNFLLGSTSSDVLESSLRHLKKGSSLMDNPFFVQAKQSASENKPSRLYLPLAQSGKLFLSYFGKPLQKYAEFFRSLATWVSLDGSVDAQGLQLDGYALLTKAEQEYFSCLHSQTPQKWLAPAVLPPNTLGVLSLGMSDWNLYKDKYTSFLEFRKQGKAVSDKEKELEQWFTLLYPTEVSMACIPFQGHLEWVGVIHSKYIQQAKIQYALLNRQVEGTIMAHPAQGMLKTLFGGIFGLCQDTHYYYQGSYILLGSEPMLQDIRRRHAMEFPHTLDKNFKQTPIADRMMDASNISVFFQPSAAPDSLVSLLDARYQDRLQVLEDPNAQYVLAQISALGEGIYTHLMVYGNTLEHSPMVARPREVKMKNVKKQDTLATSAPPFTVYNHFTKQENRFTQTPWPDCVVELKDSQGKTLWTRPLQGPVQDSLYQIDFLKNNKLQMLFAVGNRLYLWDRLGRDVSPYPKEYGQSIAYGPYVFDVKRDKEYQIFLIHQDGFLRRYNKYGNATASWTDYLLPDYCVGPLQSILLDANLYWVVYTNSQTVFLNDAGETVVALMLRQCADPGKPVMEIAPSLVEVTTVEGVIITVNLVTGEILEK